MSVGPVSVATIDWNDVEYRDSVFRRAKVTPAAGGEALGCSAYEIRPGDRTWRPHYHTANEEALFVLAGEGAIRLGPEKQSIALRDGTYVALPAGPAGTHEIAVDEDAERSLLCFVFSTMQDPDIVILPDHDKAVLTAGGPPGADPANRLVSETVDLPAPEVDGSDLPDPDSLVVRSQDLDWRQYDHGERTFRRRQLGAAAGSQRLGCSTYDVPPNRTTWLRHWHAANEEALYVLEGDGTIRLGEDAEEHDVAVDDYVALPADERGTHEVTAGDQGMAYLVVSEMVEPEVTAYPDREMLGIYVGSATGGDPQERSISAYLDRNAEMEYWEE